MAKIYNEKTLVGLKRRTASLEYGIDLMVKHPEKFNWAEIALNIDSFEDKDLLLIMKNIVDKISWEEVLQTKKFSEDILQIVLENDKKLIHKMITTQSLSQIFILNNFYIDRNEIFLSRQHLTNLFKYQHLSVEMIEKYISDYSDYFNEDNNLWELISEQKNLSIDFIEKYQERLCWKKLCEIQKFTEDELVKFIEKIDWDACSIHQELPEFFIERFKNKVNWSSVSTHQKLSNTFIDKFAARVNWNRISAYQNLSEAMFIKYSESIDGYGLFYNRAIDFSRWKSAEYHVWLAAAEFNYSNKATVSNRIDFINVNRHRFIF